MTQSQKTLDGKTIGATVDYLTMTTTQDTVGVRWYETFVRYIRENGPATAKPKALSASVKHTSRHGFQCQVYEAMTWGYSEQHERYYLQITGADAHSYWRRVVLPPMVRVTRVDLAVTVDLKMPRNLVGEAWEALATSGPQGKTQKYTRTTGLGGGETLYVGSRQSVEMGRLYDKGIETGQSLKDTRWRYELEVHKPRADSVCRAMYDKLSDGEPMELVFNQCAALVGMWFGTRGVNPVFATGQVMAVEDVEVAVRTTQRRLAWLRTQVAPTVSELIQLGLGPDVARALGIGVQQLRLMGFDDV